MVDGAPDVTVVVSTYNRPDVLQPALESLVVQTHANWTALVIGDCCDARTAEVVRRIGDRRLRHINLPERCGDQSGPNSIGATLCRTPFLAFLNHDDLLLPDHLDLCLERLRRSRADFCLGRTARVDAWREGEGGRELLYRIQPLARPEPLASLLPGQTTRFEPVSSWVMRAEIFRRVGEWRDGSRLDRQPVNDWLLRAGQARLRCVVSQPVSVIKITTHYKQRPTGSAYDASAEIHHEVARELRERSPEAFRAWLADRVERTSSDGRIRLLAATFLASSLTPGLIALFRASGCDPYPLWRRLCGHARGSWKTSSLRARTGEGPLPPVDRTRLLTFARASLGETP